jgi:hypothetical protein
MAEPQGSVISFMPFGYNEEMKIQLRQNDRQQLDSPINQAEKFSKAHYYMQYRIPVSSCRQFSNLCLR